MTKAPVLIRSRKGFLVLFVVGLVGVALVGITVVDQLTICRLKVHLRRMLSHRGGVTNVLVTHFKEPPDSNLQHEKVLKWVTAYYPVWALGSNAIESNPMHPSEMNWRGLTHVVHFAAGPQKIPPYWSPMVDNDQGRKDSIDLLYAGDWIYPVGSYHMPDSLRKYAIENGVKVLLSGGGGGVQGEALNYITQDSSRTQVFVDALLGFAKRYGYDGIEVDWETSVTRDGMSRLTRVLRRGLSTWTPKGELVFAVTNGLEDMYDIALNDSVDQYNLMLYDMHLTPSFTGCQISGFNSPLFPPSDAFPGLRSLNWNYDGVLDGSVNVTSPGKMIAMGWPREKLGAGLPFFGYLYAGIDGPNKPSTGITPRYVSITEIEFALRFGGRLFFDDSAKVPWIGGKASRDLGWKLNSGQDFYITFDDTSSLKAKVAWAGNMRLGGLMIYELWNGWLSKARGTNRDPLLQSVLAARSSFLRHR